MEETRTLKEQYDMAILVIEQYTKDSKELHTKLTNMALKEAESLMAKLVESYGYEIASYAIHNITTKPKIENITKY